MMKKLLVLCLTICCFAATSLFAADSKEMFKKAFDKMETLKQQGISCKVHAVTDSKKKKSIRATIYMKGDKIRIEAKEGVTIINEDTMYLYSQEGTTAAKINIDKENVKQVTFNLIQDKAGELNFVNKASKNGYSCQVFKSKDKDSEVVYYLTEEYGLPTYIKEESSETNITNFKIGDISDSLFSLPKDFSVVEVSNLSPENLFGLQ